MKYQPVIRDEETDLLMDAVLTLETPEDCYRLFADMCTIKEIQDMAQRIHVAQLLKNGTTYHDIIEKTGASTATISRVNRCLHYGAGGYIHALEKITDHKE